MVTTIIRGYRLDDYISGLKHAPQEYIPAGVAFGDGLLESIATEVMGRNSARGLWFALEKLFGAYSKARMDELRDNLQTICKGSTSMADYLQYLPITYILKVRELISWQELQEVLLGFDSKLGRLQVVTTKVLMPLVQVFQDLDHLHTLPTNKIPTVITTQDEAMEEEIMDLEQIPEENLAMEMVDENYKGTTLGGDQNKEKKDPVAFIATPDVVGHEGWYADSGASNHITSDAGNVTHITNYGGKEKLTIAQQDVPTSSHAIFVTQNTELVSVQGGHPMITRSKLGVFKPKTWVLVKPSPEYNVVGNNWVFKEKYNADGSVQRLKTRLVAKGFHEIPGLNFGETFSPVIKPSTIRVVLFVAVSKGWKIKQLDINNAFPNGKLEEVVYMVKPQGFVDKDRPDYVCKLEKSLYGLLSHTNDCWKAIVSKRWSNPGQTNNLQNSYRGNASKKQIVVSRSSTKSEYRALTQISAEIIWLESLLQEMQFTPPSIPVIWCNNTSASALASNPVYHARTKHIELDIHFVRDRVL
uniref:Reverse transcriptase Ty1/copia-type domain-containing protein n=1 Tax=Cannabis sativa TaxID=3483 RepID=A0A803P2C3_CANSA